MKRLETRVNELEKQETVNCPESVLNALQVLQVCQGNYSTNQLWYYMDIYIIG